MPEVMKQAAIVIVSDSAYDGEREDAAGPRLALFLQELGFVVIAQTIVPDERDLIASTLFDLVAYGAPLVVTTGGTGLSPRDITPEATLTVIEREVPGLAEEMRRQGLQQTRFSLLSRGVAGVRDKTLIVNLPGNPDGAVDSLAAIADVLPHALTILQSQKFHHDDLNDKE